MADGLAHPLTIEETSTPTLPPPAPHRILFAAVAAGVVLMFLGAVVANTLAFTLAEGFSEAADRARLQGQAGGSQADPEADERLASMATRAGVAALLFNAGLAVASLALLAGALFGNALAPPIRAALAVTAGLLLLKGFLLDPGTAASLFSR